MLLQLLREPIFSLETQLARKSWREFRPTCSRHKSGIRKHFVTQFESFRTVVENQFVRSKRMQPELQGCLERAGASIFPSLPFDDQRLSLHSNFHPLFK